jgi:Fur family ferric uptake transcriptional regulator
MSCGERLATELRRAGFRVTPQRTVILETIAHQGDHLSANEVYLEANKRLPGLNIATIYRTLESLHRVGLIDLLSLSSDPVRFSIRNPLQPHGHLVCKGCKQILEVDTELIGKVAQEVERDTAFIIDVDHLTLTGLCKDCVGIK